MSKSQAVKKQFQNRIIRKSVVSEIFANDLMLADEKNVKLYFEAIIEASQYANCFHKMELNLAALQEAHRVLFGLWSHWVGHSEASKYYKPHQKTLDYIESIRGNTEKFLVLALDKYWSALGSAVRNKNLPKVYYSQSEGGNNE
ncbi:MAG: hypothetical protein Q7U16_02440 [Agitococcus sp.]|nr:hypothetical protein [Agitococcus sp.]